MCLEKFVDFSLNNVLREFFENEQVMLFKTLSKETQCKRSPLVALRNAIKTGCPDLAHVLYYIQ